MLSKREPRLRKRKEQADAFIKSKQQQRHEMFMKDVLGSVPEEHFPEENNGEPFRLCNKIPLNKCCLSDDTPQVDTVPNTQTTFDGTQEDEEAARLAAIAESRRKLAELECDRPLWEESARRREASERAAAEAARAQAETMRAAEERRRQQHARTMREAEERARQAEARRAAEAESERRRAAQQQQQQRFARGPWTTQRALERYRTLCDAFDISRFGVDNPLRFERVPWPVLHNPLTLCIEDIDWSAVEAFFAAVRPSMRAQDYKVPFFRDKYITRLTVLFLQSFVEKSQRRFHPDKWRSKLNTILDEQERESVDVAVGTVAQAITPLWRELKR
jgi:flagellar biosynthesis GTPase FlhF